MVTDSGKSEEQVAIEIIQIIENVWFEFRDKSFNFDVGECKAWIIQKLIDKLREIKLAPCLSDNETSSIVADEYWVIRALGDTVNFNHGYANCDISVSYVSYDEVLYGFTYDVYTDVMYYAIKGKGAYAIDNRNGEECRLNASDCRHSDEALIGFDYVLEDSKVDQLTSLCSTLMCSGFDLRCSGSIALDLCHVASGVLDAFFAMDVPELAYSAGKLILSEADGSLTDWNGNSKFKGSANLLATNDVLDLLPIFSDDMTEELHDFRKPAEFITLPAALSAAEQGAFVSNTIFEEEQSLHFYNGKFYYEDGAVVSPYFLKEQDFAMNNSWFILANAEYVDKDKLKAMHESSNGRTLNKGSYNDCIITGN